MRWSSHGSWALHTKPGEHSIIVINKGETLVLDESATVKGIIVNGGNLVVEDSADIELSTDYLLVLDGGLFQVGTEDNPFVHEFTLTLEGDDPDFDLYTKTIVENPDGHVAFLHGSEYAQVGGDHVMDMMGRDSTLNGDSDEDTIFAKDGNDVVRGEGGADYLYGQ